VLNEYIVYYFVLNLNIWVEILKETDIDKERVIHFINRVSYAWLFESSMFMLNLGFLYILFLNRVIEEPSEDWLITDNSTSSIMNELLESIKNRDSFHDLYPYELDLIKHLLFTLSDNLTLFEEEVLTNSERIKQDYYRTTQLIEGLIAFQ